MPGTVYELAVCIVGIGMKDRDSDIEDCRQIFKPLRVSLFNMDINCNAPGIVT